ncbi:MAG: phage terminase large subunit [Clostridia bacterium]|jgi:phage terminase large subunit|nr:phage terminase large subunit [Clostridia bacterium]
MLLHLSGTPNPKQQAFFLAKARHIAYGGARGGGKSWAMRRKFVLLAFRYDRLELLLLRRTLPELMENHVRPLLAELSGAATYHATRREFLFPNGSRIKLGYCDKESDVYQYQGQEYDVVGLEEATHFSEAQMQFLTTCNRSVRSDFSPRMYYTMNPGGVGHAWVKRLFIDRDYRNAERAEDYVFIPARLTDNPILLKHNPGYVTTLKNLPEHLRKAHLDGDWDALAGQYFPEFSRDRHVVSPFSIPQSWRRFRAMDWGYNDPCCVLWFAAAPDGKLIVYRELYLRQTLSSEIAKRVHALSEGESIAYTAASPDAWQQRGLGGLEGQTIAEVFARNGVPLLPADNARIPGWQRVREALALRSDGTPGLTLFSSCQNLIRTLPLLTYDAHNVEDVSAYAEDHAAEALRYGLMSRPHPSRPVAEAPAPRYDPFSIAPAPYAGYRGL